MSSAGLTRATCYSESWKFGLVVWICLWRRHRLLVGISALEEGQGLKGGFQTSSRMTGRTWDLSAGVNQQSFDKLWFPSSVGAASGFRAALPATFPSLLQTQFCSCLQISGISGWWCYIPGPSWGLENRTLMPDDEHFRLRCITCLVTGGAAIDVKVVCCVCKEIKVFNDRSVVTLGCSASQIPPSSLFSSVHHRRKPKNTHKKWRRV